MCGPVYGCEFGCEFGCVFGCVFGRVFVCGVCLCGTVGRLFGRSLASGIQDKPRKGKGGTRKVGAPEEVSFLEYACVASQMLLVRTRLAARVRISAMLKPHDRPSVSCVVKSKLHPAFKPILRVICTTLGGL